jgi:single stranded DNA-binding protein
MKISCVPPEMQTLALGAESARSEVPQLQGQKRRNTMYQNRVHLIGYLGRNPEQKSAKQSGRKYTVFSLATKRAWKGADEEWHSKTEWHRIIAWNGLGEYAAAKLRKGDHIYIEGTLVSNIYEKKVNKGKNATSVEITFWQVKAQSIRKLNRVKSGQAAESLPSDAEAGDAPF